MNELEPVNELVIYGKIIGAVWLLRRAGAEGRGQVTEMCSTRDELLKDDCENQSSE